MRPIPHPKFNISNSRMRMSRRFPPQVAFFILVILLSNGCAAMARPTAYAYPQRGQTAERQAQDRAECMAWAQNETGFDPEAGIAKGIGTGAVIWGLVGAATGAAISAAVGRPDIGAAIFAAAFGIPGAVGGGLSGYKEDKDRFNRAHSACMATHSYEVR